MSQLDDVLEQKINELEGGASLETVIRGLPEESRELEGLLRTVDTTRSATHPTLTRARSMEIREKMMNVPQPSPFQKILLFLQSSRWMPALAGFLGILLIGLLVTLAWLQPAAGKPATVILMDIQGVVETNFSDDPAAWTAVQEGDTIQAGAHIRTYADSGVTLVFPDGSRSTLGADTNLNLAELTTGNGDAIQVSFNQFSGFTSHSVVPLRGDTSYFHVITNTGQVSVHGTIFDVDIEENGDARVAVVTGEVAVSNEQGEVTLTDGQTTTAGESSAPEAPAYEFSLQGTLEKVDGSTWYVSGVPFSVDAQTQITGSPVAGDMLLVRGHWVDGIQIADTIELSDKNNEKLTFNGPVESMGDDAWTVGGITIGINAETELSGEIQPGDAVKVHYVVLEDGTWLAKEIELLEEEREEQQTTRTPALTGTVEATLTTGTPEASMTPEARENGVCGAEERQQPEALNLAGEHNATYEEIMGWFCQGYGFGEIDQFYTLSEELGVPVTDIFSLRAQGLGVGQIRQQLQPTRENGRPTPKPTHENNAGGKKK